MDCRADAARQRSWNVPLTGMPQNEPESVTAPDAGFDNAIKAAQQAIGG